MADPLASDPPATDSRRPAITRLGWQLDLTGYVQADSVAYSQDSLDELTPDGTPLNEQRFLIRRGRLRGEARRDAVWMALEFDGNTLDGLPAARLLAAQVGWTYPARGLPLVAITAGLFKIPFGAEVPGSERDKPFLEPPVFARALFPGNYDAGAMASGAYGAARWSIALMNGSPVGDAQWRGQDPTASYDLVGRIGAVVPGPRKLRVEAGLSAITGQGLHPGTPPTKDQIEWVDENQDGRVDTTELRVISGTVGMPSTTFDRDALGADLALHWCICRLGTGVAFAETVLASNLDRGLIYADPLADATNRTLRHLGFSVGVVQAIGPYALVGVRYDRYDADRDAFERQGLGIVGIAKAFSTMSVMATARWRDAKFLVQYDHERNPFGRDDTGMPITREDDRVTLRAQAGF